MAAIFTAFLKNCEDQSVPPGNNFLAIKSTKHTVWTCQVESAR